MKEIDDSRWYCFPEETPILEFDLFYSVFVVDSRFEIHIFTKDSDFEEFANGCTEEDEYVYKYIFLDETFDRKTNDWI